MIVVRVEEAEKVENPHGVDVRKLIDMGNAQIFHITLKPGEELKRHTTPVDAFLYIIKGKGIAEVGEEKEEVKKATLVYLPKEVPHKVANTGSLEMEFLVIKVK
ncbi:cupin domain-containing protein [Thermococcus paralvinellae]|uniref:Carbohydrate-binding protein n=1 Tax=Thermococcus paralvinellae TaxID=582419 RepID=W0I2J3_9EURY|nr:cupin domain-containing protein [Thermococcus paralvinellae]AHF80244.1 carbohydrate-binding protein [Thermococcus paralvinellae]